jgi:8-amino-7-oxononanoate synthase
LTELAEGLAALGARDLRRDLTVIDAIDGPRVRIDGRELICWCSNDYLGLSQHPALIAAAHHAATEWGIGARASRLLAGTTRHHQRLEEALAAYFGAEAALVYPSGYLTNFGAVGALLSPQDAVFVDRLAHASLLDAARQSRARFRVFPHNDVEALTRLLGRAPRVRRRMIITEGVFSMDGDRAPLAALVETARAHEALVYLDDAHGSFVVGPAGRGSPEAAGVPHDRLLYMGTLGKALGCQGGFVVGPRRLIDYLSNRSRAFIYTTALAVPVVAAAMEALSLVGHEPQHRSLLWQRVRQLHTGLAALGHPVPASPSHIIPVRLGEARRARELSQQLWDRGLWAPAIRPPTVPQGGARLRLSITARHTESHIDALVSALRDAR